MYILVRSGCTQCCSMLANSYMYIYVYIDWTVWWRSKDRNVLVLLLKLYSNCVIYAQKKNKGYCGHSMSLYTISQSILLVLQALSGRMSQWPKAHPAPPPHKIRKVSAANLIILITLHNVRTVYYPCKQDCTACVHSWHGLYHHTLISFSYLSCSAGFGGSLTNAVSSLPL